MDISENLCLKIGVAKMRFINIIRQCVFRAVNGSTIVWCSINLVIETRKNDIQRVNVGL